MEPKPLTPSDVIGNWVRDLRTRRGWTAKQLAERCAEAGATALTTPAILNIETGRRGPDGVRRREVTVDELLMLAYVFSVPSIDLIAQKRTGYGDDEEPTGVSITPTVTVQDPTFFLRWFTGRYVLPGMDAEAYAESEAAREVALARSVRTTEFVTFLEVLSDVIGRTPSDLFAELAAVLRDQLGGDSQLVEFMDLEPVELGAGTKRAIARLERKAAAFDEGRDSE